MLERAAHASPSCNPKGAINSAGVRNGLKARGWVTTGQVRYGQSRVVLWVSPGVSGRTDFATFKPTDLVTMHEQEVKRAEDQATAALLG